MTRPTSRLDWWPSYTDPLTVRALWIGAVWHYRLEWGHNRPDGQPASDRVTWWETVPVPHRFPQPGTYTVVGRPELEHARPISVDIAVRGEPSPVAELEQLGAGRIRLRLRGWPDPGNGRPLHRVIWGDGSRPVYLAAGELAPEHTYPAGTVAPQITVTDLPARRSIVLTGPDVPVPDGPLDFAWNPAEHDQNPKGTWRTLLVWGLTPGARYKALMPWRGPAYAELDGYADEHGAATLRIMFYWPERPEWRPRWHTTTVAELDGDGHVVRWLLCPYRMGDSNAGIVPIYDWSDADPQTITLRELWPPQRGTYTITWQDGGPPETVDCDGVTPWRATHRYPSTDPAVITVTAPDGSTGQRRLAPITIHNIQAWRAAVLTDQGFVVAYLRPAPGDDEYQQIRMRIDKDGMPTQSYAWSPSADLPDRETQFNRDVWANRAGETYTVSAGAAFTRPLSTQVTIPPAKTRQPPPPPVPDPHRDRNRDKENNMTYPPALVAERYVTPEMPTTIRLLHVPAYFERVHFTSEAFQGGESQLYPATIGTDDAGRRYATAEVKIRAVDPASFQVKAIGNDDDTVRRWLLVEAPHDGKMVVTGDKPAKPGELVQWQFSGLSRNPAIAWAASDVFLNGRDPKALTSTQDGRMYEHGVEIRIEGNTTWYGLVYHTGTDNAHQGIVVNPQAQPGPYTVQVAQEFVGGHREIITGATTVPSEVRAGKPQFTTTHRIILAKLGDGDTIVHTINFGEGFEQTNTNYTYDFKLKTIDPATGKPVKPTLQEAQQLILLKEEYHFVRHLKRLELHTLNPHTLRGNSRFQPIYIVTVFPVEDDAGYSGEQVPEISEELVNA